MIEIISGKIRELRKDRRFTLKDLSQKTGLSVSFLSQVENGTSSLAITSLKKISDALNVSINYFFDNPEPHKYLTKLEDRSEFQIEGSNSKYVRLSGDFPDRAIETLYLIIPPEQQHGHKFSHPGEEFMYVLEGTLIANVDGTEYILNQGDSIHYPSTLPHVWINPLKQEAKILSITSPAIF